MPVGSTARTLIAVGLATSALVGGRADAVDQGVFGRRLVMRMAPGDERLNATLRGAVIAPTPGGTDDPSMTGASLEIDTGAGETATLALPAGNWIVRGGGTTFVYRNQLAPAGPSAVRRVVVKQGRKVRVISKGTGITLDEPSQGSVRLRLTSGSSRYCALFDGPAVLRDEPGLFVARNAPTTDSCATFMATTTSSTSSTSTTNMIATSTTSTSSTTIPDFASLAESVGPNGDADGDGYSNTLELASCSNPADATSTPLNDDSLCANATVFSDTLGPAWGNTNHLSEPTYNAAVAALQVQNVADCGVYCQTTPNIGSPEACNGNWPWSGVPEHGFYEAGETVEVNFPDEDGNRLAGTIFLPPGVTCLPAGQPHCDGITDAVVCTAPGGATYPAVVICDGFTGTQRMYYWAGHRLAEQGYVAMTFDVSGQGRSQGTFPNGDQGIAADLGTGDGFARDIGAAMNFVVSAANPVRGLIAVSPLLIENQTALGADHTEPYVLGVAGHSAGATATVAYQQSTEALYPVRARAGVGWSHFDGADTIGNIPLQLHSGDEDSGFIQPPGSGNTAPAQERRYDRLGGDRDLDSVVDFTKHDRQIIMTEDGTHLDYSQVPWAYTPTWGEEVQYHYTLAWFDKYLRGDVARTMSSVVGNVIQNVPPGDYAECTSGPTCFTATQRLKMSHVHLSGTWCSRYDVGGVTSADMKGGGCVTQ
jgi:dienelactone hydrolase